MYPGFFWNTLEYQKKTFHFIFIASIMARFLSSLIASVQNTATTSVNTNTEQKGYVAVNEIINEQVTEETTTCSQILLSSNNRDESVDDDTCTIVVSNKYQQQQQQQQQQQAIISNNSSGPLTEEDQTQQAMMERNGNGLSNAKKSSNPATPTRYFLRRILSKSVSAVDKASNDGPEQTRLLNSATTLNALAIEEALISETSFRTQSSPSRNIGSKSTCSQSLMTTTIMGQTTLIDPQDDTIQYNMEGNNPISSVVSPSPNRTKRFLRNRQRTWSRDTNTSNNSNAGPPTVTAPMPMNNVPSPSFSLWQQPINRLRSYSSSEIERRQRKIIQQQHLKRQKQNEKEDEADFPLLYISIPQPAIEGATTVSNNASSNTASAATTFGRSDTTLFPSDPYRGQYDNRKVTFPDSRSRALTWSSLGDVHTSSASAFHSDPLSSTRKTRSITRKKNHPERKQKQFVCQRFLSFLFSGSRNQNLDSGFLLFECMRLRTISPTIFFISCMTLLMFVYIASSIAVTFIEMLTSTVLTTSVDIDLGVITNLSHTVVTILFIHWIKGRNSCLFISEGVPYDEQGEMNAMTVWEQLEAVAVQEQLQQSYDDTYCSNTKSSSNAVCATTRIKQILYLIPTVVTYMSCASCNYQSPCCQLNILFWFVCIIGKLPCMNGVRLFGINRTAGIDDDLFFDNANNDNSNYFIPEDDITKNSSTCTDAEESASSSNLVDITHKRQPLQSQCEDKCQQLFNTTTVSTTHSKID